MTDPTKPPNQTAIIIPMPVPGAAPSSNLASSSAEITPPAKPAAVHARKVSSFEKTFTFQYYREMETTRQVKMECEGQSEV
jgi:hypothetical protein